MEKHTAAELKEMLERGDDVIVVDVLGHDSYARKHIPAAINIPLAELERSAHKVLPKTKRIVLYCDTEHCSDAEQAAFRLKALGYDRLAILEGGRDAWQQQEYSFVGAAIG